jgi:hypothetical protein
MRGMMARRIGDALQNRLHILQHFMVPESQDPIATLAQMFSPTLISLRLARMVSAVKFHHEISFTATEIHDVMTDGMLAAELETVYLSGTQAHPEFQLSVSLIVPQAFGIAPEC